MTVATGKLAHSHDTGQANAGSGSKIYRYTLMPIAHGGGL